MMRAASETRQPESESQRPSPADSADSELNWGGARQVGTTEGRRGTRALGQLPRGCVVWVGGPLRRSGPRIESKRNESKRIESKRHQSTDLLCTLLPSKLA